MPEKETDSKVTNSKLIPPIPLPFKEVMKDVLKVKPPEKRQKNPPRGRKARATAS
jgi:hypothetical protein